LNEASRFVDWSTSSQINDKPVVSKSNYKSISGNDKSVISW